MYTSTATTTISTTSVTTTTAIPMEQFQLKSILNFPVEFEHNSTSSEMIKKIIDRAALELSLPNDTSLGRSNGLLNAISSATSEIVVHFLIQPGTSLPPDVLSAIESALATNGLIAKVLPTNHVVLNCPEQWIIGGYNNGQYHCIPDPKTIEIICGPEAGITYLSEDMLTSWNGQFELRFNDGIRGAYDSMCVDEITISRQNVLPGWTGNVAIVTWPLKKCNTELRFDSDKEVFQFRNYVDLIHTKTDGIYVSEDYRFPFQCEFPQKYIVNESHTVMHTALSGLTSNLIPINFDITLYADSSYTNPTNKQLDIGKMVYFGLQSNNLPPGINWAVTDCSVRNLDNKNRYAFFENGCGINFLKSQHLGDWLNGPSDFVRMKYQSFAFPNQYTDLILQCNIELCKEDENCNQLLPEPTC